MLFGAALGIQGPDFQIHAHRGLLRPAVKALSGGHVGGGGGGVRGFGLRV